METSRRPTNYTDVRVSLTVRHYYAVLPTEDSVVHFTLSLRRSVRHSRTYEMEAVTFTSLKHLNFSFSFSFTFYKVLPKSFYFTLAFSFTYLVDTMQNDTALYFCIQHCN